MPEIAVNEVPHVSESEVNDEDRQDSFDNKSEQLNNEKVEEEEWLDVLGSGDLKMKTLEPGQPGTRPQNFDIATVKLKGELEDGTVVEEEEEFEVEVNGSDVVQGLDLVLPLLDVGQSVTAIVKSRFGYGALGLPPKIPPHATIIYTVKLLKFVIPPELTNVPFCDRQTKAINKKNKGNWWYKRNEGHKAVQCYRSAIDALQDSTPYIDEQEKSNEMPEDVFREIVELRVVLYNNLAAAQMLIEANDSALVSLENVIKIEPNNVKALYRMGKILSEKGKTDEALEIVRKILTLEPENSAARKMLSVLLGRQAVENVQAKKLYKKMFGGESEKKTEENEKSSKDLEKNVRSPWTKVLGALAGATIVAAIAFGLSSKY